MCMTTHSTCEHQDTSLTILELLSCTYLPSVTSDYIAALSHQQLRGPGASTQAAIDLAVGILRTRCDEALGILCFGRDYCMNNGAEN